LRLSPFSTSSANDRQSPAKAEPATPGSIFGSAIKLHHPAMAGPAKADTEIDRNFNVLSMFSVFLRRFVGRDGLSRVDLMVPEWSRLRGGTGTHKRGSGKRNTRSGG
jgi:hypothetical protein